MKNKMIVASVALAGVSSLPQYVFASDYEDMQRQIQSLQTEMEKMKALQGKGDVSSSSRKVNLEISGHINRALQYMDDGSATSTNVVDSDASATRLRAIATAQLNDEVTFGGAIEVQLESNSTAKVNQLNDEKGDGTQNFTDRRAEIFVEHALLGKLWLGQGWTASDNTSELDFSDTWLASSAYAGTAAGVLFRDADGTLDTIQLWDLTDDLDGLGRQDRVRYDTPTLGGVSFATSYVQGGAWDAAVRYAWEGSGIKLNAALAYADASGRDSADWDNNVNGSVAVELNSGFNALVSLGTQDMKSGSDRANAGADPFHFYTKVGYKTDSMSSLGQTAFSIDYRLGEDQQQANDELTGFGIQAVQSIRDYGTDIYAGLNQYQRDMAGRDFDDVTVAVIGARVKF